MATALKPVILGRRATAQRLAHAAAEDAQHTDGQLLAEAADNAQRAHRDIYAMYLDITSGRIQTPVPAPVVPMHPNPCPGLEHTTQKGLTGLTALSGPTERLQVVS